MIIDNPFYILNVAMSATRREISAKAEEQSFIFDADVCNEAQACLTNPAKRVAAEIGWFPGESDEAIASIRSAVDRGDDIDARELGIHGKLIAAIDKLIGHRQEPEELIESINTIDICFDIDDAESLLEAINDERKKAGIAETDLSSVQDGQLQLRELIRTTITEKFAEYDDTEYMKLVSQIAETCLADSEMSHGVVVDDVINQYELRMQPVIETDAAKLREQMDAIRKQTSPTTRSSLVNTFIVRLMLWDEYVQPLQLLTLTEGLNHSISRNIAIEARDLAITLHNDFHDIDNSEKIINALTEVFAELPELTSVLNDDQKTLNKNKVAARTRNTYDYSSQTPGSSDTGSVLSTIMAILLRFWWIILILIFVLVDCGGDSGSSTYDSNDSAYEDEYADPYEGLVEQEMPENEYKFVNTFGDNRPSEFVVENPTDNAYVMKFEDSSGNTVFSFFVRPQSTTPMYMGTGTYYLKYAAGTTWYGEDDLFGPDTIYKKMDDSFEFSYGTGWTLTMQQLNGNVSSESIDEDEF